MESRVKMSPENTVPLRQILVGPRGDKEEVSMSYTPNPPLDPLPWAYAEVEHRDREGCGGVELLSSTCRKERAMEEGPGER